MKFVFFGSSKFSTYVLDELNGRAILPKLIVTAPDKPKGRRLVLTPNVVKVWAKEKGIEFIEPQSLKKEAQWIIERLNKENTNFFLVASYGKIIPQNIFDIPEHKTLNIHPSLLPKYRGASPIISQILNDESEIGTSIMVIDEGMDTGPVVAQKKLRLNRSKWDASPHPLTPPLEQGREYGSDISRDFPLLNKEGVQGEVNWPLFSPELEKIMAKESVELFAGIIDGWLAGKIKAKPQDDSLATICQKIEKEDGLIDLNGDPKKNLLKIMAFADWPRAYFFDNGKRIVVTGAKIEGRALKILSVIPEGKREMSYDDYKRGNQ